MKKILVMLVLFAVLIAVGPTSALNQSGSAVTPASVNVNYFVVSNTNFWVNTTESNQTALNFTTKKNENNVQPQGQNNTTNTPWAIITNAGDVVQSVKAKLGVANPTGLSLYLSNSSDYSGQVTVNPTTAVGPTQWSNVAALGGTVASYFRLNAAGAVDGTYSNTIAISAS